jgi:hypothetical protein
VRHFSTIGSYSPVLDRQAPRACDIARAREEHCDVRFDKPRRRPEQCRSSVNLYALRARIRTAIRSASRAGQNTYRGFPSVREGHFPSLSFLSHIRRRSLRIPRARVRDALPHPPLPPLLESGSSIHQLPTYRRSYCRCFAGGAELNGTRSGRRSLRTSPASTFTNAEPHCSRRVKQRQQELIKELKMRLIATIAGYPSSHSRHKPPVQK